MDQKEIRPKDRADRYNTFRAADSERWWYDKKMC